MKSPQKLVNQLRDAIAGKQDPFILQNLAAEYAELIRTTNLRLEQCALILQNGNEYQAIQLAEVHPPLLDLVATLSFKESNDWKALCQARSLPIPERLDERAIRALNDLYQKGLSPTHPYYKQYRAAMFERNNEKALEVLLTITRLNASDQVAKTELERLQKRVLEKIIERLDTALPRNDVTEITDLLSELERYDPKHEFEHPSIAQAHQILAHAAAIRARQECVHLISQLHSLHEQGKAEGVLHLLEAIYSKRAEYQITFDPETEELFSNPNSWLMLTRAKLLEQAREAAATADLKAWLKTCEEDAARLAHLSPQKIVELRHTTETKLKAVQQPTPALQQASEQWIQALTRELTRRTKTRNALIITSSTIAILLVIGILWLLLSATGADSKLKLLEQYKTGRNISKASTLLSKLNASLFLPEHKLAPYRSWVESEETLQRASRTLLERLQSSEKAAFADRPVTENMEAIAQLRTQSESLAPEFREEINLYLDSIRTPWEEHLKQQRARMEQDALQTIRQCNTLLDTGLDFAKPPPDFRQSLTELSALVHKLELLTNPGEGQSNSMPSDIIAQAQSIQTRTQDLRVQLYKYDEAIKKISEATLPDAYTEALKLLAQAPFGNSPEVRAARNLMRNEMLLTQFPRQLLMPSNTKAWDALQTDPEATALPKDATSEEITLAVGLRDHPDLRDIHRHKLVSLSQWAAPASAKKTGTIYTRGPIPESKPRTDLSRKDQFDMKYSWKAEVYDPAKYPDRAQFLSMEYNGTQNTKSNTAIGDVVLESTITPEAELLTRLGLDDFYNGETRTFTISILRMLDRLREASGASPLWQGYVHLKLYEIAELRPGHWGLALCPAASEDIAKLRSILTPPPAAGDWMVPRKAKAHEKDLNSFYTSRSGLSYHKLYLFHHHLLREASRRGLAFAGYIRADGEPHLTPNGLSARELWGISENGNSPALLYRYADAQTGLQKLAPGHPLSPLFSSQADPATLLREAIQAAGLSEGDSSSYTEWLPPYFKTAP